MTEQKQMTEERLKEIENAINERAHVTARWAGKTITDLYIEIRRLKEENERLRKDNELGWTISEELSKQISAVHEENEKLKRFYNYFADLYGQNLEVLNWHQNGATEPFDSFFDSAECEMEVEK